MPDGSVQLDVTGGHVRQSMPMMSRGHTDANAARCDVLTCCVRATLSFSSGLLRISRGMAAMVVTPQHVLDGDVMSVMADHVVNLVKDDMQVEGLPTDITWGSCCTGSGMDVFAGYALAATILRVS